MISHLTISSIQEDFAYNDCSGVLMLIVHNGDVGRPVQHTYV